MAETVEIVPSHMNSLWRLMSADATGLEPALTRPERLVFPDSWAGHLPFAFWIVATAKPRRYVELGVHTGNSYCAIAQAVTAFRLDTLCFGVDHWFGDVQAGLYGEDVYADLKAWHDPRYGQFSRLMRMSFANARAYIEDASVDLLHIDGLHTYEAVREDFETWESKLSDRAIVLFHDTNVFKEGFGVCDYWREIKSRYPTFEFLNSNGLGVAYVGSQPLETLPAAVASLFSLTAEETAAVRLYFSCLGDAHIDAIRSTETRRRAEETAEQLHKAYSDLAALDQDRSAILSARTELQHKAVKWDQLYVKTGGAISVDIDELSLALGRLYNSDNPQARRDRDILKRQFTELVKTGTLTPQYKDLALRAGKHALKKIGVALGRPVSTDEDSAIASIRDSGFFDEGHYTLAAEARAAGVDPLEHYLQVGEAKRVAPSAQFDPDYYARRNPDVAQSGFGLLRHFVLFGRNEQRPGITPAKRMTLPTLTQSERPRVLLVLGSDPYFTNSCWISVSRQISKTHDIIAFVNAGTPLPAGVSDIMSAVVTLPDEPDMEGKDRNEALSRLVDELQPSFALVMSVSSRINVRGLAAAGLGVVQVVDAFSSSVRPYGSAYEFLPWAHRLVFPSRAVVESFAAEHPYLSRRQMNILPPAAELTPARPDRGFGTEQYHLEVRKLVRPAQHQDDFIVLGSGELTPASGIEAFIALAAETGASDRQGRALRYIWVTQGSSAYQDGRYEDIIQTLIKKSGIKEYISILNAENDLSAIMDCVDIYASVSVSDAMSQISIAALRSGTPVVCIDNANSIAEILKSQDETRRLVAPHLRASSLADIVLRLSSDKVFYSQAQKACLSFGANVFSVESYADGLRKCGEEARQEALAIGRDYERIAKARPSAFDEAVFGGSWPADRYPQDLLHTYLLRSRIARALPGTSPSGLRRPIAGFNPVIYAEDCKDYDGSCDPLAHWLEKGRPEGRWAHALVHLSGAAPAPTSLKALVHGHFYYIDLLQDFLTRLSHNASVFDLIVTVPDDEKAAVAQEIMSKAGLKGQHSISVVGNKGRDIGPFLSGIDRDLLSRYDVVGHFHGKKSPHVEKQTGDQWREFLWEHLIGNKVPAADVCLGAFSADPRLGLVFPEDAHIHGWDQNFDTAQELARRMGRIAELPRSFEWPIGTMFWARTEALKPLFDLKLDWADYPAEPLPSDGTLLHAIERVIPFAVEQAGFGYAASYLPEIQR
ncbi:MULTISPECIES: rhamnan synthesis F family protein [unclassified Pannonibacter]|uniref:rhamnan synthesis F family protein n=1 Tax=unclassified Pannonibacter TaxID=2627228 RepID=UPI001648213F|nr:MULTISPECIES: rhamnan synthesis F family protein [unclassified Pannonibacter]